MSHLSGVSEPRLRSVCINLFYIIPLTILEDRIALQNMVEEMYPELPERKPKKKKYKLWKVTRFTMM